MPSNRIRPPWQPTKASANVAKRARFAAILKRTAAAASATTDAARKAAARQAR